jgi:hypothetical protein
MRACLLLASVLLVVPACGSSPTVVPDTGTTLDSGALADTGAPTDSGAPTDTGTATDGGPTETDAPVSDDAGPLTVAFAIESATVFADCMPIVASDPIDVTWDTEVTSSAAGTATATATLRLFSSDGSTATQIFSVTPDPITYGVGSTTVPTSKDGGGPIDGCAYCGGTATLEVRYEISPGDTRVVSRTGITVGCAF